MTTIQPGAQVVARTADGQQRRRRAITGVVEGLDFLIVRVCSEDEWKRAQAENRRPEGLPWPAEDVQAVEQVPT